MAGPGCKAIYSIHQPAGLGLEVYESIYLLGFSLKRSKVQSFYVNLFCWVGFEAGLGPLVVFIGDNTDQIRLAN